MVEMRKETDSLGVVEVPADKMWGAQTQRSLEHFSIGKDLIPREMITSYATLKDTLGSFGQPRFPKAFN
jgi:fumarate hydratase class II